MLSHPQHPQACPGWGAGLWGPPFNDAFPPSASSGCPAQGVGQWNPPLIIFFSPQHPWGALDGEQDNGILLLNYALQPPASSECPGWGAGQWRHPSRDALQLPSVSFALFLLAIVPGKSVRGSWHSPKCTSALSHASTWVVFGSPRQCRCSDGPGTLPHR